MKVDWDEVYNLNFIAFEKCWEKSNSYCCKSNSPYFDFRLLPSNAASMIFFYDEYQYLKSINKLQEGFHAEHKTSEFNLTSDRKIRFVTSYCRLGGLCTIPEFRPVICKIYPFFPRISISKRKIVGYLYSSVLDQYWEGLNIQHPCHIVQSLSEDQIAARLDVLSGLLKYPFFLFYFKAIEIIMDNLRQHLKSKASELFELPPKEFFKRWEMIYLTGKAFDKEYLRNALNEVDAKIKNRFGDYEI